LKVIDHHSRWTLLENVIMFYFPHFYRVNRLKQKRNEHSFYYVWNSGRFYFLCSCMSHVIWLKCQCNLIAMLMAMQHCSISPEKGKERNFRSLHCNVHSSLSIEYHLGFMNDIIELLCICRYVYSVHPSIMFSKIIQLPKAVDFYQWWEIEILFFSCSFIRPIMNDSGFRFFFFVFFYSRLSSN